MGSDVRLDRSSLEMTIHSCPFLRVTDATTAAGTARSSRVEAEKRHHP
jgi:hypothetical protein